MDLASHIFTHVLGPLAAFAGDDYGHAKEVVAVDPDAADSEPPATEWRRSFVNPQSRIDSLVPVAHPTWRLDGIDRDGQRFFAVPTFALDGPPLRIDVFIPPLEEQPRDLRRLLRSDALVYATREPVQHLPICQHVLRSLQYWSARVPDFQRQYSDMPFGSRVLMANLTPDVADMDIHLMPDYGLEQSMLTVDDLQAMWDLPSASWPPVLDLADVHFRRQIHDAIAVVRIPSRHGGMSTDLVFKSLVRDQRHMYHELKMLLTLRPHANLVRRPLHVVTKRARFGGKRGVCGFVLPYYPRGSLQQRLAAAAVGAEPHLTLDEKFRWSRQVAGALVHLNGHRGGFYPDLKPDNIVLSEVPDGGGGGGGGTHRLDAVLIDLEQRGGFFSWSPPEVLYVEYFETLASSLPPSDARDGVVAQLRRHIPGWEAATQQDRYRDVEGGFSAPWVQLLRRREADAGRGGGRDEGASSDLDRAQSFMLGKLLWCIFEEQPFVRSGIDHDLLKDDVADAEQEEEMLAFPRFRHAPDEIRELIRRCTRAAPEWEGRGRGIMLQGGKLRPASGGRSRVLPATETWAAARLWWIEEVRRASAFMSESGGAPGISGAGSPFLVAQARMRPSLEDALAALTSFGLGEREGGPDGGR